MKLVHNTDVSLLPTTLRVRYCATRRLRAFLSTGNIFPLTLVPRGTTVGVPTNGEVIE